MIEIINQSSRKKPNALLRCEQRYTYAPAYHLKNETQRIAKVPSVANHSLTDCYVRTFNYYRTYLNLTLLLMYAFSPSPETANFFIVST